MTLLLAHPEAEDLGQFVEGTLNESERAVIVQHVADCDECRMLIVDAAEFSEPAKAESRSWWMQIAASLILVAVIGGFTFNHFRDPLAKVEKSYAQVPSRPLEARLSGFSYTPRRNMRGAGDEADPMLDIMKGDAAAVAELTGNDAKTVHARGIALLLIETDPKKSLADLQAAVDSEPNNAKYQSDLAAALITAGERDPSMLPAALAACDRALRIDPNSPDALFNRAVALQALGRPDAVAAYETYLKIDPSSPWAREARNSIELLRQTP